MVWRLKGCLPIEEEGSVFLGAILKVLNKLLESTVHCSKDTPDTVSFHILKQNNNYYSKNS